MMSPAILVSGASGFVGSALATHLKREADFRVRAAVRDVATLGAGYADECVAVGDIGPNTDWRNALKEVQVVIHLAARVHVMRDRSSDPLYAFRRTNVEGTLCLARQAARAGVRRVVFVSSVKVNGEATVLGHPFRPDDLPAPLDPYGISKREAEDALRDLSSKTGLEVVIVRPPLVYGPGVRANFLRLMQLVRLGLPLPLGSVDNRRSMVALDNLVDLLTLVARHPGAVGRTFMVSDGTDLSLPQLVRLIGNAMQRKPLLLPVPVAMFGFCARALGRSSVANRLLGSLQVDISETCDLLGWRPPVLTEVAVGRTVSHFMATSERASA